MEKRRSIQERAHPTVQEATIRPVSGDGDGDREEGGDGNRDEKE